MAHHNPYVECPYNMVHQVPKLRLQQHLLKCRKSYPLLSKLMKSCPFNATHIMPETELKLHLTVCPERCRIEGQKYNCLTADHGDLGTPSFQHAVPVETWDDTVQEPAPVGIRNRQLNPDDVNYDPFQPGGALGVSSEASKDQTNSNIPMSFKGMGRGRLNHLLSQMRNDS